MALNLSGMPRRTVIAGVPFTVEAVPSIHFEDEQENGETKRFDVLGVCHSDTQTITIAEYQGPDRFRETFLHEHLHAMMDAAGLRDTIDLTQDESIAKRLAPIMLQFLRYNPEVIRFLTQEAT